MRNKCKNYDVIYREDSETTNPFCSFYEEEISKGLYERKCKKVVKGTINVCSHLLLDEKHKKEWEELKSGLYTEYFKTMKNDKDVIMQV